MLTSDATRASIWHRSRLLSKRASETASPDTRIISLHLKAMEIEALHARLADALQQASSMFQKVPGSAVLVRYVRSSYQNDPVRSAIELVLVLFFIRYLLSPSYSTHKQNYVKLREDVRPPRGYWREDDGADPGRPQEIDELIDDWAPEPLVAGQTPLEEAESEKLPVIVGYGTFPSARAELSLSLILSVSS